MTAMMKEKKKLLMLLMIRLLFPAISPSFAAAEPTQNEETVEMPEEEADCKELITQKGRYTIQGSSGSSNCVSMIMAEADHFIVANVTNLSVDCTEGFIELQDGIEINSGTFPTENGLATINTCLNSSFVVSKSNVAQLLYGMGSGESFVIDVDFKKDAMPCDMILREEKGRVVISNIPSNTKNCTLFFPFKIQLRIKMTNNTNPRGTTSSRQQQGSHCPTDYMEVRGGEHLSYSRMTSFLKICPPQAVRARSELLRSRSSNGGFLFRILKGMDVGDDVGRGMGRGVSGSRGGSMGGGVRGYMDDSGGSSYDNDIMGSFGRRVRRMMRRNAVRNATSGETRINMMCSFTKLKLVMSEGGNVTTVVEFQHVKEGEEEEGWEGGMNYQCGV